MHVVDSSGWIEEVLLRPNHLLFRKLIADLPNLLVPTISIHEVVRIVTRARDRKTAEQVVLKMRRGTVVDLDVNLAQVSARLGMRYNLPMGDSIIYATARAHEATLYTQDADLAKLPGVKYVRPK